MPKELRPGNANPGNQPIDAEMFSPFVDEVGVEPTIESVTPNRVLYTCR